MGRYFRYQPQHATVPEMAAYYRKLKMAFVVFAVDSPRESRKITNEEVAKLAHENSDVAIPFASVNPHRGAEGVAMARRLIRNTACAASSFIRRCRTSTPMIAWRTRSTRRSRK